MKIFMSFILGLCLVFIGNNSALAEFEHRFVNGFDALPIMNGLEPLVVYDMIFDHPSGRIIEAGAAGDIEIEVINNFYIETLPQLGWEEIEINQYLREGEILELEYIRTENPIIIRFRLFPQKSE